MNKGLTIAIDAMGGDHAPDMIIRGADLARERFPAIKFLFFGDERKIAPLLQDLPRVAGCAAIEHTEDVVTNDAKASQALRQARGSSMRLAINAVRDGRAEAVVSAGNTARFRFATSGLRVPSKSKSKRETSARRNCLLTLGQTLSRWGIG